MKSLFIDCPTGLAGDMLLAGLLDLGVPLEIVRSSLSACGLDDSYRIKVEEVKTYGFRGCKISVQSLETNLHFRTWKEIRGFLKQSSIQGQLKEKIIRVFNTLAEAESSVHGQPLDDVHFHEVGAIDSLVDVIGVCSCLEHIQPEEVVCSVPPVGQGTVATAHGDMPVPVPAVLELAKRFRIPLSFDDQNLIGELVTPTGLALMAVLADRFSRPNQVAHVSKIGIGVGHRDIGKANFLRACVLQNEGFSQINQIDLSRQELVIQEAWIDDSTPEDIAALITDLREGGAIDVVSNSIQMKKGRQGVRIVAIVKSQMARHLTEVWFSQGVTLGLRESIEERYTLPRRNGFIETKFGKIKAKQVKRPSGSFSVKAEHDHLIQLSKELGESIESIRNEIMIPSNKFYTDEDWSW